VTGVADRRSCAGFLPAQHSGDRNLTGCNRTLWGGWGVTWRGKRFYYAGDTAYVADLFRLIRRRFGAPHLAAIPIGAYTPMDLMRFEHLDPAEAVEAHRELGAGR
jgi:N-acyl-phosphatidylethanolamine-hydrolysing phospholipase D